MVKRNNWDEVLGENFGRLTIVKVVGRDQASKVLVQCTCECGSVVVVRYNNLSGTTKSCGCLKRDTVADRNYKHGYSRHPDFQVWVDMNKRCHGNNPQFTRNYKDRGITVCPSWRESPEAFFADMGPRPPGATLERVDNEKGYSARNCVWADMKTQQNNKRTNLFLELDGVSRTLSQWADVLKIHKATLHNRYMRGWSVRDILMTPVSKAHSRSGKKAA